MKCCICGVNMQADVHPYEINPDSRGIMTMQEGMRHFATLMGESLCDVSDKTGDKQIECAKMALQQNHLDNLKC